MLSNIEKIINKTVASKDGKTIFENFSYLTLLQIASYVFPLITMPYLARVIGAEGFGKLAFASAVIVWFQTIADWGFNFTATRDVAQHRDDKNVVSRIFSNVLWARCLLALLSSAILCILILLIPIFRENALIITITFLMIPGHILFPDWFFQAVEKMKYTTIFNLIIKFIFTIAVFVFIHEKEDYYIQPILTTIGYVACGIIALYLILHKWGYQLYRPKWSEIYKVLKGSTDVFINNLVPNLYNSFTVLLLGFVGGSVATGLYDGGNKFPTIYNNFQLVLSRTFFPFLSRRPDKHSLFCRINLISAFVGTCLLFFFSPIIVKIMLGPEFSNSILVMRILSISVFFLTLGNTYGTNYLIIYHKEKSLRNITLISSIIGMLFAFPLVYYYSYIGAAITILLSRGILGILTWSFARGQMNVKY